MLVDLSRLVLAARNLTRLACAALAALMVCAIATPATAQTKVWYLDRAQISGAPDDGFMVWRPYLYEKTRFYGMMALGYSMHPLRAGTVAVDDNVAGRIDNPVQGQIIDYLSVGTEIAGRAGINVALPIALYNIYGSDPSGEGVSDAGIAGRAQTVHDLRLDARVKLAESANKRFRFGLGGALFVGTGDRQSFAGDGGATGWLYAAPEYDFGKWFLAGMIGPHFRPNNSIGGPNGDLYVGSEMRWALGGYVPFKEGRIRLGLEFFGSTGLFTDAGGKESTFFRGRNTPLEWLAQARFGLGERQRTWAMVGAGTRLSGGYGAPDLRVLASIGHFFTIGDMPGKSPARRVTVVPDVSDHASDRDHDGYPDDIDKCPDEPEDGKPPDPTDGCPAGADRDHDGIPDASDACPDVPEDKDGIQDNDGCPEDDADNDQIPDKEDKCPLEVGLPNKKNPAKNGCPGLTKVTEEGEVALLEPIQFDFAKATIKPVSFPILDEVVALLKARPKIHMGIYGHTDNRGGDELNLRLSKDRAKSVVQYIQQHGIAGNRLESEGYGKTKPIDTNDTDEGRAKNRRVEFKILSE